MKLVFTLQPSASGYCNTMDAMPGSGNPSTRRRKGKKSGTMDSTGGLTKTWGWGTANPSSSTRSNDSQENMGLSTLGGKAFVETYEFNAMTYIEVVKKTFRKTPEVYKEFKQILSQIRKNSSKKVDLIKRIIMLFDGYPHLIRGFGNFLPPEITMEVQDDAVVLNVEDQEIGSDYEINDDMDGEEDDDMMRYIRNVKWTYMHQAGVYEKFNRILQDYNRKNVNENDTVSKIASLFEGQPDLVLGFNIFLPSEYKILEHEKRGYVVRHPCKKGLRPHYTPVSVKEVYIS